MNIFEKIAKLEQAALKCGEEKANADYIALAKPDLILEMINLIRRLMDEREKFVMPGAQELERALRKLPEAVATELIRLKEANDKLEKEADWLAEELGECYSPYCRIARSRELSAPEICMECWRMRARTDDIRLVHPKGKVNPANSPHG